MWHSGPTRAKIRWKQEVVSEHLLMSLNGAVLVSPVGASHALKRKWTWMLLDRPRSAVTRQGAAVRMCVWRSLRHWGIILRRRLRPLAPASALLLLHPTHSALSTATPDVSYSFLLPLHCTYTLHCISRSLSSRPQLIFQLLYHLHTFIF